jgi:hypothetical protein
MAQQKILIDKLVSVDALAAGSVVCDNVTSLDDEVLDNSVEGRSLERELFLKRKRIQELNGITRVFSVKK